MDRIARNILLSWFHPGTWTPTSLACRSSPPRTKDGKRRSDKHPGVSKHARAYRSRVMGMDLGAGS